MDGDLGAMIERAAGYGLTPSEIGYLLGLPTKDVAAYDAQLQSGMAKAKFKVSHALFGTAIDQKHKSHVTAAIFWLKARAGWVEARPAEDGGGEAIPTGGPRREIPDDEVRERFDATLSALRPKSTKAG